MLATAGESWRNVYVSETQCTQISQRLFYLLFFDMLSMYSAETAKFFNLFKALQHTIRIKHNGVAIRGKVFEGIDSFFFRENPHLISDTLIKPGDGHME